MSTCSLITIQSICTHIISRRIFVLIIIVIPCMSATNHLPSSFFFLMNRRPPRSPLFPSTTLFRSRAPFAPRHPACRHSGRTRRRALAERDGPRLRSETIRHAQPSLEAPSSRMRFELSPTEAADRSEEHTSELQSHLNPVCRLLLEK